jgi:PAS domain S-box-containing protein
MSSTDHNSNSPSPTDQAAFARPHPTRRRLARRPQAVPDRFETLVQLAPDATVVADANGRIRVVNHQTEELFGYSEDELLDQPIELLIPKRLHTVHRQHRAEYARAPQGRPMGAHLPMSGRRRDGSEFPIEESLGPLDEGGESLVIVSIRDITERQRIYAAAEAANQDLRALQALTDTALSHLALGDLLTALLKRVTSVLQVDNAAVLLLDEAGKTLTVQAIHGLEAPVAGKVQVPMGQGFAGRIAASREPLVVDDIATIPLANPFLRRQLHSVAGVPLLVGDQLLGVVHVGTVQPRHFTAHDVQLLQQVADRMALAIDRARLYGRVLHAREIAEAAQERAETALAQVSEHRYRCLVEANIIGIAVSDGEQILEANDAYLRLVGCTRADLEAGRLRRATLLTADTWPMSERSVLEALMTGASTPYEREFVRKDGTRVSVLGGRALVQRDPVRLVNFVLDVTERKQLEQMLAERVTLLEAVMEAVPEALTVYDANGRIALANTAHHAEIARLIPRTPSGKTIDQRSPQAGGVYDTHGTLLEDAAWPQSRALQGEVVTGADAVEMMVLSSDGEPTYFSATSAPLRDASGHITGAVALSRDITEYKRLERERAAARASELAAQEVAQQLDAFFTAAAHDIRTPITVFSCQVQLALRRARRLKKALMSTSRTASVATSSPTQTADAVVDSLRAAGAGVERLHRLVAQLFDVAQARRGTLTVELVPCDLSALVHRNVTAYQAAVPERRIVLEVPTEVVLVEADANRLDQVLSNYLTNALKYSPADQPVTVRLEVEKHLAVVSVVDHGPGLPQEEQSRIWELFHRAPGIEVQSGKGEVSGSLGLGLHICKQLIELHPGGSVGVESVVGEGSIFWFQLPLGRMVPPESR